jgi:hypothetical protein
MFPERMKICPLIALFSLAASLPLLAQAAPAPADDTDPKKVSLITRIESELGKPLESGKAEQLKTELKTVRAKIRKAQDEFADSVASAAKVTKEKITDILPGAKASADRITKDFIPKLEKAAGRTLQETEVAAIQKAQEIRKTKIEPAQEELEAKIIGVTGLAKEKVEKLLKGEVTE